MRWAERAAVLRSLILRRMLACFHQHAAEVYQRFPIQLQGFHGGAPNRREAQNLCCVIGPGKMRGPVVAARIEQSDPIV